MNLYLDSSALVKRYLIEPGTPEIRRTIEEADIVAATVVSRAEAAAAFAKAVRMDAAEREAARSLLNTFQTHWSDFFSLDVSRTVVERAERRAFEENLRGYDAVHLASALVWQGGLGEDMTFATFGPTPLGSRRGARADAVPGRPAAPAGDGRQGHP